MLWQVQFADGGYKRFSKADFEKAMVQDTENAVVTESFKFEVGKVIFLQGVGCVCTAVGPVDRVRSRADLHSARL